MEKTKLDEINFNKYIDNLSIEEVFALLIKYFEDKQITNKIIDVFSEKDIKDYLKGNSNLIKKNV